MDVNVNEGLVIVKKINKNRGKGGQVRVYVNEELKFL